MKQHTDELTWIRDDHAAILHTPLFEITDQEGSKLTLSAGLPGGLLLIGDYHGADGSRRRYLAQLRPLAESLYLQASTDSETETQTPTPHA